MGERDALLAVCAGGGGYGDPLLRSAADVCRDVEAGLVSEAMAQSLYGVVTRHGTAVDEPATQTRRAAIRAERGQSPVAPQLVGVQERVIGAATIVADGVHLCAACHAPLGKRDADPKQQARMRARPITCSSPWNRYGATDAIVLREFTCPSCAHLLGVQVARATDPVLFDTFLA
jgi:N-methylhydantoinase B